MSSKYYDKKAYTIVKNNYEKKEVNVMTRNQLLLDKDTGYKTKWHNLLVKIDNLTLPIATKFELAKDIEELIDDAMTISSNHTEVDSTAWLRSNY